MKNLNVVIGRFQPVHVRHLTDLLLRAIQNKDDEVLILVGSSNRSRTPKNPFLYNERVQMIKAAIEDLKYELSMESGLPIEFANTNFMPLNDYIYSDDQWKENLIQKVSYYKGALEAYKNCEYKVRLFGNEKDSSSYYLKMFSEWEYHPGTITDRKFGATNIREAIYNNASWEEYLLPSTVQFIEKWLSSPEGAWVINEVEFLKKNKATREKIKEVSGYEPVYLTVDAICFHRERVLMIERPHNPGKGLLSLPGGYVHADKTPISSCISRVREETKLKIQPEWATSEKVYAHPNRSTNGRICTIGFVFSVPERTDQNPIEHSFSVNNLEDNAKWLSFSEIEENRENIFEDHYDIVMDAKRKLNN